MAREPLNLSPLALYFALGLITPIAHAAHPLESDDTGTQGAGHWQLEVNTDQTRTRASGQTAWARQLNATLTRGVTDTLDLAASLPLQRNRAPGERTHRSVGDVALQAKWRFYDDGSGWSLALRPTVTLPTGHSSKGFGNGRATAALALISTLEAGDWVWLANASATFNSNRVGERQRLCAASTAVLYKLTDQWSLAMDVGASRRAMPGGRGTDRFALLGAIWHVDDKTDLDWGWRRSLSGRPVLNTFGVGLTVRW